MNSPAQNVFSHNSISGVEREAASGSAEVTLRLIARLPAPEGLEDRVMAGLKTAPRAARVLHWPAVLQPATSWMRGAAAAAIVFVVAGGGWESTRTCSRATGESNHDAAARWRSRRIFKRRRHAHAGDAQWSHAYAAVCCATRDCSTRADQAAEESFRADYARDTQPDAGGP